MISFRSVFIFFLATFICLPAFAEPYLVQVGKTPVTINQFSDGAREHFVVSYDGLLNWSSNSLGHIDFETYQYPELTAEIYSKKSFNMELQSDSTADFYKLMYLDKAVFLVIGEKLQSFIEKNYVSLDSATKQIKCEDVEDKTCRANTQSLSKALSKLKNQEFYDRLNPQKVGPMAAKFYESIRGKLEQGLDLPPPIKRSNTVTYMLGDEYEKKTDHLIKLNKPTLIMTHAQVQFYSDGTSFWKNANKLLKMAKNKSWNSVYLLTDDGLRDQSFLLQDRNPTFALQSESGEHRMQTCDQDIIVAGGFFSLCHAYTVRSLVRWNNLCETKNKLRIFLPMQSIYYTDRIHTLSEKKENAQNQRDSEKFISDLKRDLSFTYVKTERKMKFYLDGEPLLETGNDNSLPIVEIHLVSDDEKLFQLTK